MKGDTRSLDLLTCTPRYCASSFTETCAKGIVPFFVKQALEPKTRRVWGLGHVYDTILTLGGHHARHEEGAYYQMQAMLAFPKP